MSIIHIDTETGDWVGQKPAINDKEAAVAAASVLPGVTPGEIMDFYSKSVGRPLVGEHQTNPVVES